MSATHAVTVRAPAKVNLTLEVLRRRPDGYHELATVFQAVSIFDRLTVTAASGLSLRCDRPDLAGDDNLVLRAARMLAGEFGVTAGARLQLEKHIPVAAGLGGGSADAAAALVALARLWDVRSSPERLVGLATRLGSDVAFFLGRPTALATGRGDVLTALPSPPALPVVVVRPAGPEPLPDKTRRLYAALLPEDFRTGSASEQLAATLRRGKLPKPDLMVNSFDRAAVALSPSIAACRATMLACGADWVRLAGSGPCLFTLFAGGEEARALSLVDGLRSAGHEAYACATLNTRDALACDAEAGVRSD
jgi:4-diphosphocytidyl-2-C-methyl-D-erythritol kinase